MRLAPEFTWQTDLAIPECKSRLERATEKESASRWFRFGESGTVYSRVGEASFRLFAKGPAFVHNSFEPYLYGSFARDGGRTVVRGRFRPHTLALGFMVVWFTFVLLVGGLITVRSVTGSRGGDLGPGAAVLFALGMLTFGITLVTVGWRMGRGQRERVQKLVEETLEARLTRSGPRPVKA